MSRSFITCSRIFGIPNNLESAICSLSKAHSIISLAPLFSSLSCFAAISLSCCAFGVVVALESCGMLISSSIGSVINGESSRGSVAIGYSSGSCLVMNRLFVMCSMILVISDNLEHSFCSWRKACPAASIARLVSSSSPLAAVSRSFFVVAVAVSVFSLEPSYCSILFKRALAMTKNSLTLSNCLLQVATGISISFFILAVMVVAIGLIWSPDTGC